MVTFGLLSSVYFQGRTRIFTAFGHRFFIDLSVFIRVLFIFKAGTTGGSPPIPMKMKVVRSPRSKVGDIIQQRSD